MLRPRAREFCLFLWNGVLRKASFGGKCFVVVVIVFKRLKKPPGGLKK